MAPADRPELMGRSFSAWFDPRPARAFVTMGVLLFGTAGLATLALLRAMPMAPLFCIGALLFHFWPVLVPRKPSLYFSIAGFRIDGIGLIPWEAIVVASYVTRNSTKPSGRPLILIEISLIAPLSLSVVRADDGPPWRRWQARNWRKVGDHMLVVLLSGLSDPPHDIRRAFETFHGKPINGPRGLVA